MNDGTRANDVAERLAHLALSINSQPWAQTCFGNGRPAAIKKRGPINGVEPDDLFADEMKIGGPESGFLILRAADGAEIRRERVEPDVKNVRLLTGNGNAPANRGARDAEIAEAAFDEAENFVAAGFGLDEIGCLAYQSRSGFWNAESLK